MNRSLLAPAPTSRIWRTPPSHRARCRKMTQEGLSRFPSLGNQIITAPRCRLIYPSAPVGHMGQSVEIRNSRRRHHHPYARNRRLHLLVTTPWQTLSCPRAVWPDGIPRPTFVRTGGNRTLHRSHRTLLLRIGHLHRTAPRYPKTSASATRSLTILFSPLRSPTQGQLLHPRSPIQTVGVMVAAAPLSTTLEAGHGTRPTGRIIGGTSSKTAPHRQPGEVAWLTFSTQPIPSSETRAKKLIPGATTTANANDCNNGLVMSTLIFLVSSPFHTPSKSEDA